MVQRFLVDGTAHTPFESWARVEARSYSAPLQRRIVDFAADVSFGEAAKKVEEHYNIEVPPTTVQRITKRHAERALDQLESQIDEVTSKEGSVELNSDVNILIGETDGTMIPIVSFKESTEPSNDDQRKLREVCWKEAKLSLAGQPDAVERTFAATLNGTDSSGDCLYYCATQEGFTDNTVVHCLGDGAPWIANQVDRVFGTQGSFLVDFFHVAEYLAEASKVCAPGREKCWTRQCKDDLKQGRINHVLSRLIITPADQNYCDIDNNPVRICYRYLRTRRHQLNYKQAIEQNLPIGSGEIESAHRTVIQRRLKIAGAWWLPDTAQKMLALRCLRANGGWASYWEDYDGKFVKVA